MSPRLMPRASSSPASAELRSATVVVSWQHWIAPVEQSEPPSGVGVATTRVARAAVTKANSNNQLPSFKYQYSVLHSSLCSSSLLLSPPPSLLLWLPHLLLMVVAPVPLEQSSAAGKLPLSPTSVLLMLGCLKLSASISVTSLAFLVFSASTSLARVVLLKLSAAQTPVALSSPLGVSPSNSELGQRLSPEPSLDPMM